MNVIVGYKSEFHYASIDLVAQSFTDAFEALGFNACLRQVTPDLVNELSPQDLYLQIPMGLTFKPPCRTIVYNCDLLPFFPSQSPGPEAYWNMLKKDLALGAMVFDYDPGNVEFLRRQDVVAQLCPFGYSDRFQVPPLTGPLAPDIYFMGNSTVYRRQIIRKCKGLRVAPGKNLSLKRSLLCTDGVHLLLRSVPELMPFDCLRAMLLLANKRCVLSEPPDWSPLRDKVHWYTEPVKRMPRVTDELMGDPKRRMEIGAAGYGFVVGGFRQEQLLETALKRLDLL